MYFSQMNLSCLLLGAVLVLSASTCYAQAEIGAGDPPPPCYQLIGGVSTCWIHYWQYDGDPTTWGPAPFPYILSCDDLTHYSFDGSFFANHGYFGSICGVRYQSTDPLVFWDNVSSYWNDPSEGGYHSSGLRSALCGAVAACTLQLNSEGEMECDVDLFLVFEDLDSYIYLNSNDPCF